MDVVLDITDQMDPARAAALHTALGLDTPVPAEGDALPPFFHQIYFWAVFGKEDLGRDGHPRNGLLVPDTGLPRRMWAGGDLSFHAPLRLGIPARKTTTLTGVTHKTGRSGPLAFVTLRHEIRQKGTLSITELQHLVFREDSQNAAPAPQPPAAPEGGEIAAPLRFTPTDLFRYSALTFNGHRIHYDEDYARNIEGYDGLVVHGPLLAQHLMLLAQQREGRLERFRFRAMSAVTHGQNVSFCSEASRYWVRGGDGRLCMDAAANCG